MFFCHLQQSRLSCHHLYQLRKLCFPSKWDFEIKRKAESLCKIGTGGVGWKLSFNFSIICIWWEGEYKYPNYPSVKLDSPWFSASFQLNVAFVRVKNLLFLPTLLIKKECINSKLDGLQFELISKQDKST